MFKITKPGTELKVLISGDPKSGKTTNAMASFPKPCIIDLEKGSLQYQTKFNCPAFYPRKGDFEGLWKACQEAVKAGFETIIIDQFSTLYMWHLDRWERLYLENEKRSAGNKGDYYKLQPSDYGRIKKSWQDYVHMLLDLPVNVVGIARRKDKYSKTELMKVVGTMVDSDKSLEYEFSYVFQFVRHGNERVVIVDGERCVDPEKKLPEEFPVSEFKTYIDVLRGVSAPRMREKVKDDQEVKSPKGK